jgi:hypothetical protein
MVRRHIIAPDSQLCETECGGVETTHHLFLSYHVFASLCYLIHPVFASLWHLIRGWVGTTSADSYQLHDHFV